MEWMVAMLQIMTIREGHTISNQRNIKDGQIHKYCQLAIYKLRQEIFITIIPTSSVQSTLVENDLHFW